MADGSGQRSSTTTYLIVGAVIVVLIVLYFVFAGGGGDGEAIDDVDTGAETTIEPDATDDAAAEPTTGN